MTQDISLTLLLDILGEDIRTEIVEGQAGIPLHLDIQVIDVETCKPIPNTFIEMWSKFPS